MKTKLINVSPGQIVRVHFDAAEMPCEERLYRVTDESINYPTTVYLRRVPNNLGITRRADFPVEWRAEDQDTNAQRLPG